MIFRKARAVKRMRGPTFLLKNAMTKFYDTHGYPIRIGDELRDINTILYKVIDAKHCVDNEGTVFNLENDKYEII